MSKKKMFYKGYRIIGCLILVLSMVFSSETVLANEVKNVNGLLTKDIHLVEKKGDFVYETNFSIVKPNTITAFSSAQANGKEKTHYGIATFKCYNKKGTWLFTVTLDATFHYNGKYVWCTYGYYSYKYNTNKGFGQSVTKNTYSSKKVTSKSKYIVKANIYNMNGYLGEHQFIISCTPNGKVDSSLTVTF